MLVASQGRSRSAERDGAVWPPLLWLPEPEVALVPGRVSFWPG